MFSNFYVLGKKNQKHIRIACGLISLKFLFNSIRSKDTHALKICMLPLKYSSVENLRFQRGIPWTNRQIQQDALLGGFDLLLGICLGSRVSVVRRPINPKTLLLDLVSIKAQKIEVGNYFQFDFSLSDIE